MLFCADSLCSDVIASYTFPSTALPGVRNVRDLIITMPLFYIATRYGVAYNNLEWGYRIYVSAFAHPIGWSCDTAPVRSIINNNSSNTILPTPKSYASNPCTWTGVSCTGTMMVTYLSLRSLGIRAPIPETALGLLTGLTYLDLSFNLISGTLPAQLWHRLPNLEYLSIASTFLTGILPTSLSLLSNLVFLNLAFNSLTGTLPTFLARLSGLSALTLSGNKFTGKVPQELCVLSITAQNTSVLLRQCPVLTCYESCWAADARLSFDSTLLPCAPTSAPTSTPSRVPTYSPTVAPSSPTSAPSSMPTSLSRIASDTATSLSEGAVGGISVGVSVFVLCILGILVYVKYSSKYTREYSERKESLRHLPIHRSIYKGKPLSRALVESHLATAVQKDYKERTAVDLILDRDGQFDVDYELLLLLVERGLPFDCDTKALHRSVSTHNFVWAKLIQRNDARSVQLVDQILTKYKAQIDMLAYTKHPGGRACIDVASAKCQELINRRLYLHECYELAQSWEHRSATCEVWLATYHRVGHASKSKGTMDLSALTGQYADPTSGSGELTTGFRVALKFMRFRDHFLVEQNARKKGKFDSKFVIGVLCGYDGDLIEGESAKFRTDSILKGFQDYPYCIVMEAADQNLTRLIQRSTIAGREWDEIRRMLKQVLLALAHIHENGFIHGDVKPPNIMILGASLKLIDLDAAACYTNGEFSGSKYSTLYSPPELLHQKSDGSFGVRVFKCNPETQLPYGSYSYDLLPALPSHDMWSVGVLLYFLCTGGQMMSSDAADNIVDGEDLKTMFQWTDAVKAKKIANVTYKGLAASHSLGVSKKDHSDVTHARHLLSLLLYKDPKKRPSARHALDHPFISGKSPARMQGEKADFDIFLSYRVDSDSAHVEALYNALVDVGLRVWWDKKCLEAGKNWEEGFCDGLVKSSHFVCLLSAGAVNNPVKPSQNFSKLENISRCDNVFLEWRLALELKDRGMIEGIFPVFIGGQDDAGRYQNYFNTGCHPGPLSITPVDAVEGKLAEHLDRQALGQAYRSGEACGVKDTVWDITSNQGCIWEGELAGMVSESVDRIALMVKSTGERLLSAQDSNHSVADEEDVTILGDYSGSNRRMIHLGHLGALSGRSMRVMSTSYDDGL